MDHHEPCYSYKPPFRKEITAQGGPNLFKITHLHFLLLAKKACEDDLDAVTNLETLFDQSTDGVEAVRELSVTVSSQEFEEHYSSSLEMLP